MEMQLLIPKCIKILRISLNMTGSADRNTHRLISSRLVHRRAALAELIGACTYSIIAFPHLVSFKPHSLND